MATIQFFRHIGIFMKKILLIVIIAAQINQNLANLVNVNGVNLPIGGRLPLPTQVLLPPHREEGQSLDDIIYGFHPPPPRNGGSFGSRLPPPPPPPPPSSSTISKPTTTTTTSRPIFTTTTTTPKPVTFKHNRINQNHNNRARANNIVETFIPTPSSRTNFVTPPLPVASRRPSGNSDSSSFTSAEEITVPQSVKHRSPLRKQYTKADLIAAANSLRPAGFDFNKVLILSHGSPSAFNGSVNNALVRAEDVPSSNSLRSLYEHAVFPLPLLDTPTFNDLKPLMEMLLRQQQQGNSENGRFGDNVGRSDANKNKVLLIIPKNMFPAARATGVNVQNQPRRHQPQHQQNNKPVIPSPSNQQPTKLVSPSSSKFIIVPKGGKHTTTNKPKSLSASSFGTSTSTTKRTGKQLGNPSTKATTVPPATKVNHVSTKGPDLQVAATSNKLSKRPGGGGGGNKNNPSSSSSVGSEKRSFSNKGDDKYSFSYSVKNDAFGDIKSHSETRNGDFVEGMFRMLEPDGYTREVFYTVTNDQGFKATVKRIPPS